MTLPENRLADASSPYLRQHRHNPVDWWPWGEEAFAAARDADKPVLLSIGYASCHWCHVMAHESFEDEATARYMNEHFVNVKVDREERPDVDSVYMAAVQAMTGQGGWPLTVVMTPDGEPFFGGTYFPDEPRHGQPSFRRVLAALAGAWRERRDELLASARQMRGHLAELSSFGTSGDADDAELDAAPLDRARQALRYAFDPLRGGFGDAPKFPPHGTLRWLLRQPGRMERSMAQQTLARMAAGGIFDQLGGGFSRYSVDARWLVPHFEKMLYDNAQLLSLYAEAHARGLPEAGDEALPEVDFAAVARSVIDWAEREMRDPGGGFYSSLDADSEGEEGRFYAWSAHEFDDLLGDDAELAKARFGVTPAGNFEGRTVLHLAESVEDLARHFDLTPTAVRERLERVRRTLLAARDKRERPALDDKVLASWNGLMIQGLADAARFLGSGKGGGENAADDRALELAQACAGFVQRELWRDGRLWHVWHPQGGARVAGLLEDHAYLGLGLLALYRADFDRRWLRWALQLGELIVERFHDAERGGFFSTPDDGEPLLVRPKEAFDAATPAASAAAAELLLQLARLADRPRWEGFARDAVRPLLPAAERQPTGFATALLVLEALLQAPREVVVIGPRGRADTEALLAELARPLPGVTLLHGDGSEEGSDGAALPLERGRAEVDGRAAAYVCERGTCKLPVTSPVALREQLAAD